VKPGQPVNTPDGPGVALHPVVPGHPEGTWWVLFGIYTKEYSCDALGESEESKESENVDVSV